MPLPETDEAGPRRPATVRVGWRVLAAVLLASAVLADLLVARHGDPGIEGMFGFHAWFAFGSCVVLVLAARALGFVLKRRDGYYDR